MIKLSMPEKVVRNLMAQNELVGRCRDIDGTRFDRKVRVNHVLRCEPNFAQCVPSGLRLLEPQRVVRYLLKQVNSSALR